MTRIYLSDKYEEFRTVSPGKGWRWVPSTVRGVRGHWKHSSTGDLQFFIWKDKGEESKVNVPDTDDQSLGG